MDYSKITISGDLGGGKSTIAELISRELHIKKYSTGDIQRKIASKYKMTTLDLNVYMKDHPEIDDEIDNFTKRLNSRKESFVMDSRMAWFFIPDSLKIYLIVKPSIAAKRIYNDQYRINEKYKGLEEATKDILRRKDIENERFKKLYNVDSNDMVNYDLIIDCSFISINELFSVIINQFQKWKNINSINKFWINPKQLIPTQDVIVLGRKDFKLFFDAFKKEGFRESSPVDVIILREQYYIYDGHKRTSSAIMNNINLIPINIIAKDNEHIVGRMSVGEYINSEIEQKFIYNWESCHNFRFNDFLKGHNYGVSR